MVSALVGAGAALLLALSGNNMGAPTENVASSLQITRRTVLAAIIPSAVAIAPLVPSAAVAEDDSDMSKKAQFRRYPQIRFIAALGDPSASAGAGADGWGLWRDDPGPRGVYLRDYDSRLVRTGGVAPAGWTFRSDDWWLEEHGLIMSNPEPLPRKRYDRETKEVLPYKRYVVTGDREVTAVLTVWEDGRWELGKGTLYDVTHLPCRSARYTAPGPGGEGRTAGTTTTCAPTNADRRAFPVRPGAEMPPIPGCAKQDYAVLFVLGEEA